jgi:hypothetical protein
MPKCQPTWNAGKTTNIRVPESKKLYIKTLLRTLDNLDWNAQVLDQDAFNQALAVLTDVIDTLSPKPRSKDARAYREAIIEALALLGRDTCDE